MTWTCPECGDANDPGRSRCRTCGNRPEDYHEPMPNDLKPPEPDPSEDRRMLDELLDLDEGLTPWEREFLDSLDHWTGEFTEGQHISLHRIYRERL